MKYFQVAIDGPSASGKGTVAKMLARKFGWLYLDTGALFRAITLHFMRLEIPIAELDEATVDKGIVDVKMRVECENGATVVYLGDENVSHLLHSLDVCELVHKVAVFPKVRKKVSDFQNEMAAKGNLVCEGRVITSSVFPKARFKFFLTASHKVRAKRRLAQASDRDGCEKRTFKDVCRAIRERDHADMTRPNHPLVKVRDAIVIYNDRTPYDAVKKMEEIIVRCLVADARVKEV